MKKVLKNILDIVFFLFALGVWAYSLYKIVNYLRLNKIFNIGATSAVEINCSFPFCPPPEPPCSPCPPLCYTPTPTPIFQPSSTPTPTRQPSPTLPVEPTPTLTETPQLTATPTPSPTEVLPSPPPSPTPPPAVGGPPTEGGPGPAEPPVCGATVPPAPTLLSVTPSGAGQVDLAWIAVSPVTHYSISYGLTSENYIYGVSNTGNVASFTVGGLDPGTNHCFAVRAVNDCAPSELSNEICTGAVLGVAAGKVLGVSTLGATGGFNEQMEEILFIIGCVCLSYGLRLFTPAKKLA